MYGYRQEQPYHYRSEIPPHVLVEIEMRLLRVFGYESIEWNFTGVISKSKNMQFCISFGTHVEVWYRVLNDTTVSIESVKQIKED